MYFAADPKIPARCELRSRQESRTPGATAARAIAAAPLASATVRKAQPRDPIEETLEGLWSDALGVSSSSLTSNFFDLGGHSLMAVRLVSEIARVFGKRLPVSFVFQAPTIEEMAKRLRGGLQAHSFVIPVRERGVRPPFFCGGGGPMRREYQELSKALGPEQPFFQMDIFNLQEQREFAGKPLYRSVVELAAALREHIASIQSSGPYFLGGLCDGGIIAFEIALQLQAEGHQVGLLAEFDTGVAGNLRRRPMQWLQYGYRLTSSGSLPAKIRDHFMLRRRGWFPSSPEEERLFRIWSVIWKAIRAYRPNQVFDGEIQFFRASNPSTLFLEDPVTGWEARASQGVRVHELPREHLAFFCDPPSQRVIDRVIEEAYRRALAG